MTKVLPVSCELVRAFPTSFTADAAPGPTLSELKSKLILTSMLGLPLVKLASFARSLDVSEFAARPRSESRKLVSSGAGAGAESRRDPDRLRVTVSGGISARRISSAETSSARTPDALSDRAAPATQIMRTSAELEFLELADTLLPISTALRLLRQPDIILIVCDFTTTHYRG